LITQILDLSRPEVFSLYCNKYKIDDVKNSGILFGLELRNILSSDSRKIVRMLSADNKYKTYLLDSSEYSDLFILCTHQDFGNISALILKLENQHVLSVINAAVFNFENYENNCYKIAEKEFIFNKAYVMGIVNVTPDSFSDGGIHFSVDDAVSYGLELLNEGADILDIGGESTRPGALEINGEEELDRIIPVIKGLIKVKPDAVISIDTTKSVVAEEALKSGAKIINDISGLTQDTNMLSVIKKFNSSLIIMHMLGNPRTMQLNPEYNNLIPDIYDFLYIQTKKASEAGIKSIFIDPGIGFGKTVEHNFEIIKRLGDFKSLGFPIIIGNSRKSFLGKTLNLPVFERDIASVVANTLSVQNGARIIRTHNVNYGVQTINLLNNIC
jgi:dihydropteroate synthase